jgi:hypothetical protein
MKFRVPRLYVVVALLTCSGCIGLSHSIAIAKGTVRIDQVDGTDRRYADSIIRLVGNTIRVFSPDSRDTLIISQTACSYVGEVQRCLPYKLTLRRNRTDHTIGFDRGAIYFNPSAVAQPLPRSSTQLPPNGVLVFVRTARGTSIAVHGTVDKVAP